MIQELTLTLAGASAIALVGAVLWTRHNVPRLDGRIDVLAERVDKNDKFTVAAILNVDKKLDMILEHIVDKR